MHRVPLFAFYLCCAAAFGTFVLRGVAPLPIFDPASAELPVAQRFDSAEATMWQSQGAIDRALAAESAEARSAAAAEARALSRESLARRPLNPRAWLLEAKAAYLLGDREAAQAAWQRSMARGPYERALVLDRADIGIRLWHALTEAQRQSLLAQLRWAWRVAGGRLLAFAGRTPDHELLIRRALAAEPEALEDFERRLERRG